MSPEILKNAEYDYKTDVWSLGVTFFMLMGAGEAEPNL